VTDESVGVSRPASEPPRKAVYEYRFDIERGTGAASRVARLVGRDKSILELGCGPGSQSRVFREQLGCRIVGIEIDAGRAERARAYCDEVHVANLETSDLYGFVEGKCFDVIVCSDVLEHLRDPGALLVKLKGFLKPDGYLVVSIPNVTHASVVYEMIHGRFEYRGEGLLDATHVRFYSCSSALSLVEESGYWVAELQKVITAPHRTEFNTTPISVEDHQLLAAIRARNLDAETYQFVIKAYPLRDGVAQDAKTSSMREEIRQLQQRIASYESELRRLRSAVGWYEAPFAVRLLRRLKSAAHIGRKPPAG
jgi:2-polyprenyl-3-methyl-5-hydroxy-6-metoxy-1,4-benzoquinol methylase